MHVDCTHGSVHPRNPSSKRMGTGSSCDEFVYAVQHKSDKATQGPTFYASSQAIQYSLMEPRFCVYASIKDCTPHMQAWPR